MIRISYHKNQTTMKFVYIFIVLFVISIAQCPNNCSNHGTCMINNSTNTTYCECEPKYAKDNCSYLRKEHKQAIGYEGGLGFFGLAGFGRMYLGYVFVGVLHLLVSLFFCCGGWCIGCRYLCKLHAKTKEEAENKILKLVICLAIIWIPFFFVMFIWYIIECAYIGSNDVVDVNGFELY